MYKNNLIAPLDTPAKWWRPYNSKHSPKNALVIKFFIYELFALCISSETLADHDVTWFIKNKNNNFTHHKHNIAIFIVS